MVIHNSDNAVDLETTPIQDSVVSPVNNPEKNKSKIAIIFVAIFVVIIVVLISYVLITKPFQTTKPIAVQHFSTSNEVIKVASTDMTGTKIAVATSDETGALTANGIYAYSIPDYQSGNKIYYSRPLEDKVSGSAYSGNADTAKANYDNLISFFKQSNFSLVREQTNGIGYVTATDEVTFNKYVVYQTDKILCSAWYANLDKTAIKNYMTSIGCAEKADFSKVADTALPFATAYTAGQDSISGYLVFGRPQISNGSGGYKRAIVYQKDPAWATEAHDKKTFFYGMYYQGPNATEWSYFKGNNGKLECSDYSTIALKNSFVGTECTDGSKTKTVTPN